MDRRGFFGRCTAGAACLPWLDPGAVFAQDTKLIEHGRALLTDERGQPLRAADLKPQVNYLFHYPYEATPVLLIDLGQPVPGRNVSLPEGGYAWPGGVGRGRSIVAFSAICSHKLVYPTRAVNFISFRKDRARRGVQDELIHCCSDQSQYDPRHGARVVAGPAPQPLAAVLLSHDPRADSLTAYATLGHALFDAFFERYAAKLALDHGPTARHPVARQVRLWELDSYTRNNMQC